MVSVNYWNIIILKYWDYKAIKDLWNKESIKKTERIIAETTRLHFRLKIANGHKNIC